MATQQPNGLRSERREADSAAGLLGRLLEDATALVRNEVALAKAEFAESIASMKAGFAELAIGGALLVAGLLALVAAVILGLANVVAPWIAALIVGATLAVIGLALVQAARKKLDPSGLNPERTRASLRRDAQLVARRTS